MIQGQDVTIRAETIRAAEVVGSSFMIHHGLLRKALCLVPQKLGGIQLQPEVVQHLMKAKMSEVWLYPEWKRSDPAPSNGKSRRDHHLGAVTDRISARIVSFPIVVWKSCTLKTHKKQLDFFSVENMIIMWMLCH